MSWSVSFIGKPEAVAAALEKRSEALGGQSKIEYDDALPHLVALVKQTFNAPETGFSTPIIQLTASGSGYVKDGQQMQRTCSVKIDHLYGDFVT